MIRVVCSEARHPEEGTLSVGPLDSAWGLAVQDPRQVLAAVNVWAPWFLDDPLSSRLVFSLLKLWRIMNHQCSAMPKSIFLGIQVRLFPSAPTKFGELVCELPSFSASSQLSSDEHYSVKQDAK